MQHSYHSSSLTDYKGQKNVLNQGYFGGQMGYFFIIQLVFCNIFRMYNTSIIFRGKNLNLNRLEGVVALRLKIDQQYNYILCAGSRIYIVSGALTIKI